MSTSVSMKWKESAAAVKWNIQPFINGRYRPSSATQHYDNINPATELVLCHVPAGNAADIDEAVRVARQRFNEGSWSRWPPARRAQVLLKLAELIVKHSGELALLDTLEMGKPIQLSRSDAEYLSPTYLRSWAEVADKLLGASASLSTGSGIQHV